MTTDETLTCHSGYRKISTCSSDSSDMSQEFVTGFPSVRQVQTLIRDKQPVELKLLTGDLIPGKILWQDPHCICIETDDQKKHQIWKQSIAFLKH